MNSIYTNYAENISVLSVIYKQVEYNSFDYVGNIEGVGKIVYMGYPNTLKKKGKPMIKKNEKDIQPQILSAEEVAQALRKTTSIDDFLEDFESLRSSFPRPSKKCWKQN